VCRHSGACCTAGWPIPIDDHLRRALHRAGDEGRLTLRGTLPSSLETGPCRFFAPDSHLCAIHRDLGPEFKPDSCRHFPRVALLDGRGVSVTLSHFCPTAASLLFRDDVPLAIVENSPAFSPTLAYEGLDARSVLPPLLRPGLLWDLEGYGAWEEQAVTLLGQADLLPESALAQLGLIAAHIEEWTPGTDSLSEHVVRAFRAPREDGALTQEPLSWGRQGRIVNRYLAARLFASWVPYRSHRLTALLDDLVRTLTLLKEAASRTELLEAIRATDLRVVHRS